MAIVWTLRALADLEGIRAYLNYFNPSAAIELARRLVAAADSLESLPDRGRRVGRGELRELAIVWPMLSVTGSITWADAS
jgi:plasmid stabilization system protein ParE